MLERARDARAEAYRAEAVVGESTPREVEAAQIRERRDRRRASVGETLTAAHVEALEVRASRAQGDDRGVGDADVPVQADALEVRVVVREGVERGVAEMLRGVEVDAPKRAAPRERATRSSVTLSANSRFRARRRGRRGRQRASRRSIAAFASGHPRRFSVVVGASSEASSPQHASETARRCASRSDAVSEGAPSFAQSSDAAIGGGSSDPSRIAEARAREEV